MIDIKTLQDEIVTSLRAIPDLVADLGGDASLISGLVLEDNEFRNPAAAIQAMEEPSILVVFRGLAMGRRGGMPRWQYQFSIVLRAPGDAGTPGYWVMFRHIIDGIPTTGNGLRWFDSQIDPAIDPPLDMSFVAGSDGDATEWWQLNFSLLEIGA